ncbi:protein abhd-3.2-like isoform X2 [Asparagus officinalis]|uniref:protein abhd-3.2-like isoform X2 n=1 Tax=Asparagus officinalis TaxID=4686 RepID=UPI00098E6674|nr:protein abhd-3.2-like isoform X2 [Asparagus officinalis]
MACAIADADLTLPVLLLRALSLIETYQYVLALLILALIFVYNFLEVHFVRDAARGFRGDRVELAFDPKSEIYEGVVSKCRILHGRYLPTQWLASPHLQTAFLNYFGRAPSLCYRRQLYTLHDGGTIALDWLLASDAAGGSYDSGGVISKDDSTPLVIAIPGLTSDSSASYMKHLVHSIANRGWNVVVCNHRGLGGVSITSDWFYNAGWTNDVREVFNYLHQEYPKSPLFAIGTSIGANVLVKYLGEEGENTPLAGASAICSPWDLLVCDRFINRKFIQRLYNRTLATGLKGYAQLHQAVYSRLGNWDGILSSRSVREFDNHATCIIGKFETADAYYRFATSANYLKGVSIPLLCISALDDPVCTREAIPWDECKYSCSLVSLFKGKLAQTYLGEQEYCFGNRTAWRPSCIFRRAYCTQFMVGWSCQRVPFCSTL